MKRSLRRAVSLLCVLALCIGLLPSTALAVGINAESKTMVRFYVEGTGTPQYTLTNVADKNGELLNKNWAEGAGALSVQQDFVIVGNAPNYGSVIDGEDGAYTGQTASDDLQYWATQNEPDVNTVKDAIDAILESKEGDPAWENIDFDTSGYDNIEIKSVSWVDSDKAWHIHLNLVPKNITVTYHGNGGTYEGNETREDTWEYDAAGYTVQSDEYGFKRDGYAFVRWYLDKECTEEVSGPIHTTEDIDLYAKWEKTGPDITVTKELTSVVRDGKTITEGLSDSTVLYEGDQLTWEVTVKNNTNKTYTGVRLSDIAEYVSAAGEPDENSKETISLFCGAIESPNGEFGLDPGTSKTFTNHGQFTVGKAYEGYTLKNTATVTYSYEGSSENTAIAFTENPIGYTLTVQYHGNGGKAGEQEVEKETVYAENDPVATPISYTVANGANGFTREGYTFDGWYEMEEPTGNDKPVTGTIPLQSHKTLYAKWTKDVNTYGAGYFVLVPSAIPEKFNPATGYDPSQYLPYDEETIDSGESSHIVDRTTGYIGSITEAAKRALETKTAGTDGIKRLEIGSSNYTAYLIPPEDAELGKVYQEYLDNDQDPQYQIVWYQINNESVSASWPTIDEGGRTGNGYHVDGFVQGVPIEVRYYANDGTGAGGYGDFADHKVNSSGTPLKSGDSYTILANTDSALNFTRTGYTFLGWSTTPDGGVEYTAGTTINPLMDTMVLYAQWEKDDDATKTLSYTVEYYKDGEKQDSDTQIVNQEVWVNDPDTLTVKKDEINITNKYEGYTFSYSEPTDIPDTITSGSTIKVYYVKEDTPDYTVTIQPADITIYTGGEPYGGITDASGNIIVETDSGLPEPGYHLTLSTDVMTWLNEKTGTYGPRDLEHYLTFTYDVNGVKREWALTYMGVYATDENGQPTRYVYSLEPGKTEDDEEIPVRILYFVDSDNDGEYDEGETVVSDDDILMGENVVSEQYTMIINPGHLTQSEIKAKFTVKDADGEAESIEATVDIDPGTLTIRSTTDEEYFNEIAADETDVDRNAITAVENGSVSYFVNDSEVEVAADRVSLLVDEVSNNAGFNLEMARAAMGHAIDSSATDWTYRSDLSYEMAYMDLVDIDNGNAMVTMGESDSLTIYWPMPDDADPYGDFHVVHYTEMDRENTMDESGLDNAAKEILTGEAVPIDGRWYVAFDADSFSPFVLVYEEEDNDRPTRPDPDPDDDKDDEDEEPEEDLSGLNTTDHYAYIAGYEDGTVRPDGNITRAEVATIFFRLMTDEYRETCWSTSSGFTDVTAASWYNNAISTTANAGWVSGYPDGTFRPDAYITRAEFATIAARFLSDVYSGTSMFTDISGHWAEDYINRAAAAGWINGYADGTFRPNAYITRAEAVTLINRMLDRAPDANHLLADMVRWPDNPETAWYYADIQEATNSHDYTRAGTGNYEVWTELLANRDWAALEEIWSQANDAPGGEVADGLTPNGN